MTMEASADTTKAQNLKVRKRSGWTVAVIVFLAMYAVAIISDHTWCLALGWLPAAFLAASFGWLAYCLPWLIDVVAVLLEQLAALG